MAGRIPQAFIDEVVARSDIVDVIGTRVALKKAGREYKANCPFHNEKTPSFCVIPEKQFFHCFGCGAHGTVIGFLLQYEKLDFVDAITELAQRAGLELPREAQPFRDDSSPDLHEVMARACGFFEQTLADTPRALQYVATRGIDPATADRFGLGFAPDAWDVLLKRFGNDEDERRSLLQAGLIVERDTRGGERAAGFYDRFRDRLMFPIRDSRGRVIAFGGRILDKGEPKYLNSPENPLFHKGRELYGLYEARQAHTDFKRLMVVEGYMDVVRLHQAGITYAVATLGTATTVEHLNKIFRLSNELVFCFDGDQAGRKAAWRALEIALPLARDGREFRFMFLPDGHDPDTLIAAEGRVAFEARLLHAVPLSEYLVQQLASGLDLSGDEGRAKLKSLAAPLFARMPEGLYRELLAERLAAAIRMPASKLKQYLQVGASDQRAAAIATPYRAPRLSAGRGNLLSQAITLVIHHPAAARAVVSLIPALRTLQVPGVSVLHELLEQAASGQTATTAVLLERWNDRPEYRRLCELAALETVVKADGAADELRTASEKLLQAHGPARRMDELLQKAEELGLNYDEKAELSSLLAAKNRPRSSTL